MDGLSTLIGGAISSLLGETSEPGITPTLQWLESDLFATAYGDLTGITAGTGEIPPPPGPIGDITIWVRDGAGWFDRTDWFIFPMSGTMAVGSRGQITATISNAGKAAGSVWRPNQFDDIQIYVGTYVLFRGYIDDSEETMLSAAKSYYKQTLTCLTYDVRLDHAMIKTQLLAENLPFPVGLWVAGNINLPFSTGLGIDLTTNLDLFGGPFFIQPEKWDTVSMLAACKGICDEFGLEMYLDQTLEIWFFDPSIGRAGAPYPILDQDPNRTTEAYWQNLKVKKGGSAYCNRAYVRNNQALQGSAGIDNPWSLSSLSSFENSSEIGRVGPYEVVQSTKNGTSLGVLGSVATSGLVAYTPIQAEVETFQIGLEPGQRLHFDTTIPLLPDTDLLIESVSFTLVGPFPADKVAIIAGSGPIRFANTVKASNAQMVRKQAGWQVFGGIVSGIAPPVDRISYSPSWDLATDYAGLTNPGMSPGAMGAPAPAIRDGVLRQVSLSFRNPPLTTDVIMDVQQNGVSVFPGGAGITFPVGGTTAVVSFTFASDPQNVNGPSTAGSTTGADEFTAVCLQGDADAKNGLLALTVQG